MGPQIPYSPPYAHNYCRHCSDHPPPPPNSENNRTENKHKISLKKLNPVKDFKALGREFGLWGKSKKDSASGNHVPQISTDHKKGFAHYLKKALWGILLGVGIPLIAIAYVGLILVQLFWQLMLGLKLVEEVFDVDI